MGFEFKKMSIAGYDDRTHCGLSTSDKHVIGRIVLNNCFSWPGFGFHDFEIGEDLVGQKKADLIFRDAGYKELKSFVIPMR